MNVVLWIVQILLALVMAGSGAGKLGQPRAKLAESMGWVEDFTAQQVKALGAVEVLAALGLIVPALTGIAPVLTPIAAVGVALYMAGAAVVHTRRGEFANIGINVVLIVLAAVVAWGRFGPYAF